MKRVLFAILAIAGILMNSGCTQPITGGSTTTAVAFQSAVQTGGVSGTTDSTGLTLTFDVDPATLNAGDITVTGATKGALTGSGTTRSLEISAITVADGATVSVEITSPSGYTISGSPKTVVVYRYNAPLVFQSAVQTGGTSRTTDSTGLTLTFDVDPATLTAGDITVTGAAKGALTGSGTTRSLAISAITVADGATVSVAIASPAGYTISGSPKTAVTYRAVIGTSYQGGIIAYILQYGDPGYVSGETHGLIAATADQGDLTRLLWNDGSNTVTGAIGTAIGTGQANTTAIVSSTQGTGSYAAQVCNDYINANTGTGVYSDWYLPSKDELNKLYLNKMSVGSFSDINGYWSSSENNGFTVWYQSFNTSSQSLCYKNSNNRVRPVRSF